MGRYVVSMAIAHRAVVMLLLCSQAVGLGLAEEDGISLGSAGRWDRLVNDLGEPDVTTDVAIETEDVMNKAMAKLTQRIDAIPQKTNWEALLEERRDGVVQLAVVQEKYLWSKGYRRPMLEEIFGSGWFIDNSEFGINTNDDLLIVTNAHVAKQAKTISVLVPSLGQEPIASEVLGCCVERDIALLRIVDKVAFLRLYKDKTGKDRIHQAKLGDSDTLKRGQDIMAVGFPLGMESVKSTMGIVSGYQQFENALYLSMTAAINPGNSGGPLFNAKGECVGINSAKFAKASGIAFTIPSKQLKVMLDALYSTREVRVPDLGFEMSPGTEDLNEYLTGIKSSGGVYVKKVVPGGLFHQAGVQQGDLLLAVNGHKISRFGKVWMEQMKDRVNVNGLLARVPWGSNLQLHIYRSDEHLIQVRRSLKKRITKRSLRKKKRIAKRSLTTLSGANATQHLTLGLDLMLGASMDPSSVTTQSVVNGTQITEEVLHLSETPTSKKLKGSLLRLDVPYQATPKPAVRLVLEPIIDPPKFVIFGGAVFMELTSNLVDTFLEENPTELVRFTQPENCLKSRVLISNIIPGSVAHKANCLVPGTILKNFNDKHIKSIEDVCSVLTKPLPESIWSIETSSSLAVLPADQITLHPHHNVFDWCQNKSPHAV